MQQSTGLIDDKVIYFKRDAKRKSRKTYFFFDLLVILRCFMTGLYIHIPFCASRCIYCGFYSTTHAEMQDRYIDAVCRELDMRLTDTDTIATIYLGGGTPSMLSADNLQRLISYIYNRCNVSPDAEVTIECNPDDVCRKDFFLPEQVNRVSMGAQTFCNSRLKFIHRRHNSSQVSQAVEKLRSMNISNISIDLMFGFPNETLADWAYDIEHALALQPEHLSAYSLMYEEGTLLYNMLKQGKIEELSDDLSLNMYNMLVHRLTAAGYEHYEISNFAKQGYRSKHNSSYWNNTYYIGIGAAAHSYNGKTRSWNTANLRNYIQAIETGVRPYEYETIDATTHYNDMITTTLRTCEGLPLTNLTTTDRQFVLNAARPHIDKGFLVIDGNHLHLTQKGLYLSDNIMSDLMQV